MTTHMKPKRSYRNPDKTKENIEPNVYANVSNALAKATWLENSSDSRMALIAENKRAWNIPLIEYKLVKINPNDIFDSQKEETATDTVSNPYPIVPVMNRLKAARFPPNERKDVDSTIEEHQLKHIKG